MAYPAIISIAAACDKDDLDNDENEQDHAGKIKPVNSRRKKDRDDRCDERSESYFKHRLFFS